MSQATKMISSATVYAAGPLLAMGGDPTLMWGLASMMQMAFYLLFFNVKYPANVEAFLNAFKVGRLEFL